MRRFLPILFLSANLFAQQNTEKYQFALQKADYYYHIEKYDSAFNLYKAVLEIENKNAYDCVKAGQTALKINQFDFAKKCFNEALKLGYDLSIIRDYIFVDTVSDQFKNDFYKDTLVYINIFQNGANLRLKKMIDSAFITDQLAREDIADYSQGFVDTSNGYFVRSILLEYGFPTQKMVGFKTNTQFELMLEHIYWLLSRNDSNNITGLLLNEIKRDNYLIPDYSYLLERYNIVNSRQQEWGMITDYVTQDTNNVKNIRDVKNVDARRREVLLIPLKYEWRIKKENMPKDYVVHDYTIN